MLACFEGLGSDSHRVFSRFVRGSREISPVSSLYRESTDSLIRNKKYMGWEVVKFGGEDSPPVDETLRVSPMHTRRGTLIHGE